MKLTVLVCALTCLLIVLYAEGGLAAAADWCQVGVGFLAVAVAMHSAVLIRTQVGEMRRTYQAQAFLDMSKQMRHFRPVRRMMHAALNTPGYVVGVDASEQRLREYLGYLNDAAFLSETRHGREIIPRDWILELWASTITKTWPVAWRYIKKWRGTEAMGSRLYHQYEQLARECCASRRHRYTEAEEIWRKYFQRGPQ